MELERKIYKTCVDPALEVLEKILPRRCPLRYLPDELKKSVQTTRLDMRFFKMFFWVLAYQGESSVHERRLRCVLSSMSLKFRQAAEEFKMQFECESSAAEELINWEGRSYHLRKRMKQYKPLVKEICTLLWDGGFKCNSCQFDEFFLEYGRETASLIDLIVENLEHLENTGLLGPVKQQFAFIKGKLEVVGKFACVAKDSPTKIGEIIFDIQVWTTHISCLTCLYWFDETGRNPSSGEKTMFFDLIDKYIFYTPGVLALYLDVLKAMGYCKFEDELVPQLPSSSFDYLFEKLVNPSKDDIETFGEGLIFLLSFVMDAPKEEDSEEMELILTEILAIINEVRSVISESNLANLVAKIDGVKQKIRDVHVPTPLLSQSNSPLTNGIGFLDSVLVDIRNMLQGSVAFTCSVKQGVEIVYEQLALIRPFVRNTLELQNEDNNLRDVCNKIMNVVYYAAYVTKLCPVTSKSVWYGIICLSEVIEQINVVKFEVKKIEEKLTSSNKMLTTEMESSNALLQTLTKEISFIGFTEDAEKIRDHLLRGSKNLTIISITGMAGQGKTTLAKRVYSDKLIQHSFDKIAWFYVSKECNTRELLKKMVRKVVGYVNDKSEMDDLVDSVRRSLKGKRYFIVLDDIWDIDVWRQIQWSFPNDRNGSRMLFTSRNNNLASESEPNSISHHLRLFSHKESWELMEDKLFKYDRFPKEFVEIGKKIAGYCKGLPLAVTLIASHLRRTGQILDLWEEMAGNLKCCLASEGCMDIIELSYKYLADHLKPCFLYFAAFPRGQEVDAKKLKLLWIGEGFVKENETQCSEDLATNYLNYLVSQNLVVVTERSSRGWVKRCKVHHDLLYDLCLEKAVEDNFLHLAKKNIISSSQRYDFHHRLCVNRKGPFNLPKSTSTKMELPTSQIHTLLLFDGFREEHDSSFSLLSNFKLLTVLDLGAMELSSFPKVILNNIHLRYLSLWGLFEDIPPSIVDLWNLETLIMRCSHPVQTPNTLWEMKSLKYVDIRRFCSFDVECNNVDGAVNIEKLGLIELPYSPGTEKFLKRFTRLRYLKCRRGESEIHPMWFSMFGSLEMLESLTVEYDWDWPSPNPKRQLPTPNFPDNLKKLQLWNCKLEWSAMSTVGRLPNLEVLKLRYNACMGPTWHLGEEEFSTLKYLKLAFLDVERIDDSGCDDYPFPCLEKLVLIKCMRLEEIPSSFGNICTLDTIHVIGSDQLLDSVKRIEEQQRDMGNHNLQILGIDDDDDSSADDDVDSSADDDDDSSADEDDDDDDSSADEDDDDSSADEDDEDD